MSVIKHVIKLVYLQQLIKTCVTEIVIGKTESDGSSELIEATVRILKSCPKTEVSTIGIAGNVPAALVASLTSGELSATIVIDDTTRSVNTAPVSSMTRLKLQVFAIGASSSSRLEATLKNVKNSRWWNHKAQFYILDWPAQKNGCSEAFGLLSSAWRMNLLRVIFICAKGNQKTFLYTLNPYTSAAPEPWKLEEGYERVENDSSTLFLREDPKDRGVCVGVDYDKTKDLGGSVIRMSVKNDSESEISGNDVVPKGYDRSVNDLTTSVFRSLNASVKLVIHGKSQPLGVIKNGTQADGLLADVFYGSSDLSSNKRSLAVISNGRWTYPFEYSGLSVMTQYTGNQTQLKKIISLFDVLSRISLCVVCFLNLICLRYFSRQTLMTSVLNTVRLLCNAGLTELRANAPTRIYLASLFIVVVTIQGIFQGKLSSLLAKRVALPNIERMKDLTQSGHTIYSLESFRHFFSDGALQGRFVGVPDINCTEYVLRNASAACAANFFWLLEGAAYSKLHVSKRAIVRYPQAFPIRDDWPLEEKLDAMVQRLFETHHFDYLYRRKFQLVKRLIAANDNENRTRNFKVLNLEDVTFAFVLLAIGHGLAAIFFVGELLVGRFGFPGFPKFRKFRGL